jgi:hydrogenase maturation protein HypF
LADLQRGVSAGTVAARFHAGLADALAGIAVELCRRHGIDTVALSGGVMQNRTLFEALTQRLSAAGLQSLSHRLVPANDGGLALGQAVIAAAGQIGDMQSC